MYDMLLRYKIRWLFDISLVFTSRFVEVIVVLVLFLSLFFVFNMLWCGILEECFFSAGFGGDYG